MRNLCLFRSYYILCFFSLSLSSPQKTEKFLPSYETVSFAVKSVFDEFNWTEAVILATGKRWILLKCLNVGVCEALNQLEPLCAQRDDYFQPANLQRVEQSLSRKVIVEEQKSADCAD